MSMPFVANTMSQLTFGKFDFDNYPYDGSLDEVAFFDTAIDASAVEDLYNARCP